MTQGTIDVSEWLHQSVSKVYPKLLERLGVKENNGRLTCSTPFPFDELYRQPENSPIMSASHLSAAEFITTLKTVAFTRMGYSRLNSLISEFMHGKGFSMEPGYCPMTLYVLTIRALKPQNRAMVERLCFQPLRSNDWGWIIQCEGSIRESFDNLGAAIEKALDEMKKRLEDDGMKRVETRPKSKQPAGVI